MRSRRTVRWRYSTRQWMLQTRLVVMAMCQMTAITLAVEIPWLRSNLPMCE